MKRLALALLGLLLAFPAAAQVPNFPTTLPANSVVGRLGIGTGPAQAIPFANLIAALNTQSGFSVPFTSVTGQATLAQLPSIATLTGLCNITGGTAVPTACSKTQLTALINPFTTTLPGSVPAPATVTNKFLRDDGTWASAGGTGTVTSAVIAASGIVSVSGTCTITTSGTCTVGTTPAQITASLGSDVAMNSTASYFDGPSIAQGSSGTWWVSGTVTIIEPSTADQIGCKLWDGTTVIASAQIFISTATASQAAALSGYLASPVGNLRISCKPGSVTTGKIAFNSSGNSKDSTISAFRIQ